jgi:hypothetical protein
VYIFSPKNVLCDSVEYDKYLEGEDKIAIKSLVLHSDILGHTINIERGRLKEGTDDIISKLDSNDVTIEQNGDDENFNI